MTTAHTIPVKHPTAAMRAIREENIRDAQALLPFYSLYPIILQTILWPIAFVIFRIFGKLSIKGIENIKDFSRGAILAVNHTCEWDPVIVTEALPFFSHLRPCFYTSREKAFYSRSGWRQRFYGGFTFKLLGAYPVITGIRNYAKSLKVHVDLVKRGHTVIIFPEGKTTPDGKVQKGKGGVMYLAEQTSAPIIPVAIDGVFKMSLKELFTFKKQITIAFGKPMYAKDYLPSDDVRIPDYRIAAQALMNNIRVLKGEEGKV